MREVIRASKNQSAQMEDAAFAANLRGWGGIVAGYIGGPNAYHPWAAKDWSPFQGLRKLPIWVGGSDGPGEAWSAAQALYGLGAQPGCVIALDMETRVDRTYVNHFGSVLNWCGFKVWVYGSATTVFANPELNGYWVADYAGVGPFMYSHGGVRATQYASGPAFDSSTVKAWTLLGNQWWT